MAVVAATRANIAPINDQPYTHRNYRVGVAALMGYVMIWNASGFVIPTTSAPAAGAEIAGIAMQRVGVGHSIELFQEGFLAGLDVSGLAYQALLYAGASGEVETTGNIIIGSVLPFGYSGEKMAYINVMRSWMLTA